MFSQIYFIFKKNNLLSLIGLSLEMSELKNSDFWEIKIHKFLITIYNKLYMEIQWKVRCGPLSHVLKWNWRQQHIWCLQNKQFRPCIFSHPFMHWVYPWTWTLWRKVFGSILVTQWKDSETSINKIKKAWNTNLRWN